ncbi:hypothetical protein ACWGS9_17860 [Bradyrhizobium sp. Arg314]
MEGRTIRRRHLGRQCGSLSWAADRYAVHGELLARSSIEDFGEGHSFGGSVGFSVKW